MANPTLLTVAIADDHSTYRKAMVYYISTIEPSIRFIIEASDGVELIEQLEQAASPPDICILDLSMPKMTGHEAIAVISKRWPDMKVIVFSMYSHDYAIVNMLKSGACSYLLKNGDPSEVIMAIKNVASQGYHHTDAMKNYIAKMKIVPELKDKEIELLKFCCQKLTYEEIATKMLVSARTLENYKDNLCQKLNVHSRRDLELFAIQTGIVYV